MSVTSNVPVKEASIPALVPAWPTMKSFTLTDTFCQAHLTYEYQMLCRKLAGRSARNAHRR